MPLPCPRTLVALAHFLTGPGDLEDFVAHVAATGDDLRDAVRDILVLAMDESSGSVLREEVARDMIADRSGA